MDADRFDRLAKAISAARTRRGLLRMLAALPLGLSLTAVIGAAPEAVAKDDDHGSSHRRHRRRARHRHRPGQDQKRHKDHKPRKRKRKGKRKDTGDTACTPRPCSTNTCGSHSNGCGGTLSCGGCVGNAICVGGTCRACDVCTSGCAFSSVQDAVAAASPGATIHICPGTYQNRAGQQIDIHQNLTLIGAGAGVGGTMLQGAGSLRVMGVSSSVTDASLQELRITGGRGGAGAGLLNDGGTMTMTNCTVIDNETIASGGGVYNTGGGSLTLIGCTVQENDADADGGGIVNDQGSTLTLDATTVTLNRANLAGVSFTGGGIFNPSGTVNLQNGSSVTGNTPDNCAPPGSVPGCGG